MARNEAAVIGRAISSAAPYVSHVLVVDTGSTDRTVQVANEAAERAGLLFSSRRIEWKNFSHGYSATLKLARDIAHDTGDAYVWLLDADEEVEAPEGFELPELSADAYSYCRLWAGDWEVWGTRIFRADRPWMYKGKRHATPFLADGQPSKVERLEGLTIRNHNDGGNGSKPWAERRQRFLQDIEHFKALVEKDPSDTRSAYYLAQSAKDAGELRQALTHYEHRAAMAGGCPEERYLSFLEAARIKRRLRYSADDVVAAYRAAHASRPSRKEALVEWSRFHNDRGEHEEAVYPAAAAQYSGPSRDSFLVQRSAETWRPIIEHARAREGLGQAETARAYWALAARHPDIPEPERRLALSRSSG